nr:MAG TPA: hypothetical protein [Caudoviricetes sp.]
MLEMTMNSIVILLVKLATLVSALLFKVRLTLLIHLTVYFLLIQSICLLITY